MPEPELTSVSSGELATNSAPWGPALVGVEVGVVVGVLVSVAVGVIVGVSVGVAVGVTVGVSVGVAVGVDVGVTVGVLVGVLVGVVVGVAVGVDVQVASGVPTIAAITSIEPTLVRFHNANASKLLLAPALDEILTGAPFELTLTAAVHVEYGLVASRRLMAPDSSNQTTILPPVVIYTDDIDETVPVCTVLAAPHVRGLPLSERIFMSALESM